MSSRPSPSLPASGGGSGGGRIRKDAAEGHGGARCRASFLHWRKDGSPLILQQHHDEPGRLRVAVVAPHDVNIGRPLVLVTPASAMTDLRLRLPELPEQTRFSHCCRHYDHFGAYWPDPLSKPNKPPAPSRLAATHL